MYYLIQIRILNKIKLKHSIKVFKIIQQDTKNQKKDSVVIFTSQSPKIQFNETRCYINNFIKEILTAKKNSNFRETFQINFMTKTN